MVTRDGESADDRFSKAIVMSTLVAVAPCPALGTWLWRHAVASAEIRALIVGAVAALITLAGLLIGSRGRLPRALRRGRPTWLHVVIVGLIMALAALASDWTR